MIARRDVRALREAGDHDAHLTAARALVAEQPDDAAVQLEAAFAHDRAGLERDAIRYYEAAHRLGVPAVQRRAFTIGFGSTLRNVGRADEAVAVLAEAIATDPEYPAYAAFLALALADAGHPRAALAAMLGCALDAARAGVFDGYDRALSEYHRELRHADVTPLEPGALIDRRGGRRRSATAEILGAVPVGAAGAHQAELVGELDPAGALARIVRAVECLDAAEPVAAMAAEQRYAEMIVEVRMREGHRGTRGTTERECIGQRQRVVRHVDRTAVEQMARERVSERGCRALRDHRAREIGSADRTPRGGGEHRLDLDPDAALEQPRGHHAQPVAPCLAERTEPRLEVGPGQRRRGRRRKHMDRPTRFGETSHEEDLDAAQRAPHAACTSRAPCRCRDRSARTPRPHVP